MKKNFLFIIFVVIIVVFAAGVIHLFSQKIVITRPTSPSEFTKPDWFKTKEQIKEIIATAAPPPAVNFTYDGHLIKQGIGSDSESWTFLYEGPGAPAQTANLIFKHYSLCDFGNGQSVCQIKLRRAESGIKVHLEGNKENKVVTVLKIKELD